MSAEYEAFMSEIRAVNAKIDAVLRVITQPAKKPGYTIRAAAKVLDCSEKTVSRMLARGELRKVKGRIPNEVIQAHLS